MQALPRTLPRTLGPRDRVGQPSRAGKWGQIEGRNRGHRADPTRIHPRLPFQGQKLVLKTCPARRPPTVGGRGAALKFRTGFRYPKQGPPRGPKCVFLHQPFSISQTNTEDRAVPQTQHTSLIGSPAVNTIISLKHYCTMPCPQVPRELSMRSLLMIEHAVYP